MVKNCRLTDHCIPPPCAYLHKYPLQYLHNAASGRTNVPHHRPSAATVPMAPQLHLRRFSDIKLLLQQALYTALVITLIYGRMYVAAVCGISIQCHVDESFHPT